MKIQTKDPAADLALNLAPMIDVVFLLLIFFMVATTFAEKEKQMDIDLPAAESGEEATPESEMIDVYIRKDGSIVIDDVVMDRPALEQRFARARAANPATAVTIHGDRSSHLEVATEVMDVCRLAGLTDIGIMTVAR